MPKLNKLEESTDVDVREILEREKIDEAHRVVAEYRCFRTRTDGEHQELLVRINDMGPGNPNARYSWDVSVPGAKESGPVSSNPDSSIIGAGGRVHWDMLEKDGWRSPE